MSEIKVNKISPATSTDITLGDSGDTFTVPSGATIVNSGTATGFGGGKFKSVHYKQSTALWSQTCANTGTALTDGTVAFNIIVTPDSSSSKFKIGASFGHMNITSGASMGGFFLVERAISGGATTDLVGDADSSRYRGTFNVAKHSSGYEKGASMQIFDAPATASAITYTLQLGTHSATNTCYFGYDNQHASSTNAGYNNTSLSTFWVEEYV